MCPSFTITLLCGLLALRSSATGRDLGSKNILKTQPPQKISQKEKDTPIKNDD